ncbi:MAG: ankyrin repeat domain-containing protein [Puniceicoccales bacterium]
MSSRVDPNAPRGLPDGEFSEIHLAARARDVDRVKAQLDSGMPVDLRNPTLANGDGGNTPLWFAAQGPWEGGLPVARLLLESGADVNAGCEHGWSPVHIAAVWGHGDVVQLLHGAGADMNGRDADGRTPEECARYFYEWRCQHMPEEARRDAVEYFDSLTSDH